MDADSDSTVFLRKVLNDFIFHLLYDVTLGPASDTFRLIGLPQEAPLAVLKPSFGVLQRTHLSLILLQLVLHLLLPISFKESFGWSGGRVVVSEPRHLLM